MHWIASRLIAKHLTVVRWIETRLIGVRLILIRWA